MNILAKNNIDLNWLTVLIGFRNNFIDSSEILTLAYSGKLGKVDDEILVELECHKDSRELFIEILKKNAYL